MKWNPQNAPELVAQMCRRVPDLQTITDEHIEDNEELLPYVLFDRFAAFAVDNFRAGNPEGIKCIRAFNEIYRNGDEDTRTLVNTSFGSSIDAEWQNTDVHEAILEIIDPELRAVLRLKDKTGT